MALCAYATTVVLNDQFHDSVEQIIKALVYVFRCAHRVTSCAVYPRRPGLWAVTPVLTVEHGCAQYVKYSEGKILDLLSTLLDTRLQLQVTDVVGTRYVVTCYQKSPLVSREIPDTSRLFNLDSRNLRIRYQRQEETNPPIPSPGTSPLPKSPSPPQGPIPSLGTPPQGVRLRSSSYIT